MRTLLSLALLAALAVPALAVATEPAEKFKLVHVQEVAVLQAKGATLLDANDAEFRKKNGVIPGAVLLSSFNKYDVAKELPKDKSATLVFYCANSH